MTAWIAGTAVSLQEAAAEAARLLQVSRMPVVAGLATDVAGARAAILLAEKLRGAYDHVASDALLRDLDVMRQAGLMITTLNELRARADCLLLVGPGMSSRLAELLGDFDITAPAHFDSSHAPRTIIRIGAARGDVSINGAIDIATTAAALPEMLACLRARAAGHATHQTERAAAALDDAAERLKAARFGVAAWSAEAVDALSIEMLYGIITDLNKTTRFSGLPLAPPLNGSGVAQTSGWMTGFPVRTGFGRGFPEHDSWRFDALRLVDSGEADIALWISAYAPAVPLWRRPVPLIALATPQTRFAYEPRVRIDIGTPGLDHDGIEHAPQASTFVVKRAQAQTDAVPAAAALGLIGDYLNEGGISC